MSAGRFMMLGLGGSLFLACSIDWTVLSPPSTTKGGDISATENDASAAPEDASSDDASDDAANDASADGSADGGTYRCGDATCDASDACSIKGGTKYACVPMNGCALGCLCANLLLGCLGGTCGSENGHSVLRCP